MAHDVFISYAIEDAATASTVCRRLEGVGYTCWIAPRDIRPGQRFAEAIVQAIDETRVTVFVFSGNSNHSQYVHNEIAASFERNVPIIPFRIEDVSPSPNLRLYLKPVQWLDAITPPVEQHFDKLIEALDQFIPRPIIEVPSLDKHRHVVQDGSGTSDSLLFPSLKKAAGTMQRLVRTNWRKAAAVTAATLCIIGLFYAVYFYLFTPISKIGVSMREDENSWFAKRALELYTKRFPIIFPDSKIRLIYGSHEDHRDNKVLGVVGQLRSDYADLECMEYERLRLVYISPGATNPDVTSGKKYVFSMNFNDTLQGKMIANFLKYVQKCESVAVVHEETTYSTGLRSGFLHSLFTRHYPVPMVSRTNFPKGFVLDQLKPLWDNQKPVDAIVLLINSQEGAILTKELREQGFKKIIVCPESCFKQTFIDKAGEDHSNLYVATPLVEGFGTKKDLEFRNEFLKDSGKEAHLWSIFAYEAIDLLMQTYLEDPKLQNNLVVSGEIRKAFDNMRSIDGAKVSLSGPLFFQQSGSMHRPVIMTRIDNGRFRPVGTQIQDRFLAAGHSDTGIITKMMERREAVRTDTNSEDGTTYLIKIPVVYTRVQVNHLSEFDPAQKNVKIDYEISTRWPKEYEKHILEYAEAVNLVSPAATDVSGKVAVCPNTKTDSRTSKPLKITDPKMCWKGSAVAGWEPNLSRFPLDCQPLQLLVGYSGEDPLEVIMAVDGEPGKNGTVPKVAGQFDAVKCPTCSDRTYLHVQEKLSLTNPWNREALTHKYVSVYELQFILKRKPIYLTVLLLPLIIAALTWITLVKADRHPRMVKVIPGISIIALAALYVFTVVPHNVPLLSLVNGCFLGAGLIVIAAISRSWIQTITPWLRGVALLLMAAYVVAVAVFWIQWMWASCQ